MARLIEKYSLLNGVAMDIKTSPRAANAKIVMPHPTVLSGRLYEKVISIALYGLQPFSLLAIILLPTLLAGFFGRK